MSQIFFAMERNYLEAYLSKRDEMKADFPDQYQEKYNNEIVRDFSVDSEGTAHIIIEGILSRKGPDMWDRIFGEAGTSYNEIMKNIEEANQDYSVKNIELHINSPGGYLDGVGEAAQAIRKSKKKIIANIHNIGASAAYWLAAQAKKIKVASKEARVGSIGVIVSFRDVTELQKKIGVQSIEIVNSESPNKRIDPKTKKGQDIVRQELNDIFNVFILDVAKGRNVNKEIVINDFGRGGMMIAKKALDVGMIDMIESSENIFVTVGTFYQNAKFVDEPWSKSESEARWRKYVNVESSKDLPNKKYSKRFAWYDSENLENFEAYKLPYWDIKNGEFINIPAVRNGLARLDQTKGISVKDKEKIKNLLTRYLDKFKEQQEKEENKKNLPDVEGKNKNGGSYMTIEELKTSNPTLYKEIKEEGIKKERDRVLGHLTSGEKCGAIDYSHKCIRDGLTLNSQQVIAEYMTAGRNKQDVNDKEADNVDDLKTQDNTNEEEVVKKEVSKTVSFCEGLKKGA